MVIDHAVHGNSRKQGFSAAKENIEKTGHAGFKRVILLVTSPNAVGICHMGSAEKAGPLSVELVTWLDIS